MTDVRDQGIRVFREMLPGVLPDGDVEISEGSFGAEMLPLVMDNVFGRLWTREGLTRRDRSLVTLGILIALRATDELQIQFRSRATTG